MKFKKLQLERVPTHEPSGIQMHLINRDFQPYSNLYYPASSAIFQNQHLYITAPVSEPIKPGDWYLFYMDDVPDLMQCMDDSEAERCNSHYGIKNISAKIILTSNPELGIDRIPYNFLTEYCTGYDYDIDYVDVEISDEQGLITVTKYKPLKSMYSRDEVIGILKDYRNCVMTVTQKEIDYLDNFVKENLK